MQQDVTFAGAGGMKLAGTLLLPDAPPGRKVPAMLLIPGSGPTDRDGNQLPSLRTDLLKQFAELLRAQGIATFRFDKRGIGASKPLPPPEGLEAFCAWENFVEDASRAFAFLVQRPEIDPARAGILGHSEGGEIALECASIAKPTPTLLVLASTPGRSTAAVLQDQLTRLLKVQKATPEQTRFFLEKNSAIMATIQKTGKVPDDVPAGLAALYPKYLGTFYRTVLGLEPAQRAAQFPGPVLILQGERDIQVSPRADAGALDAALRRRRPDDHQLVVIKGASHNLKPVKSDDDPGFAGPIAPPVGPALTQWLTAHLRPSP